MFFKHKKCIRRQTYDCLNVFNMRCTDITECPVVVSSSLPHCTVLCFYFFLMRADNSRMEEHGYIQHNVETMTILPAPL